MILLRWFHSLKSAYVKENFPLLQSLLFPLHHYLLLFFLLSTFDDIINEFQVHLKVVKHLIWSFFRCHLNFPIHSWQNWMVNLIATAETAYFAPLLYSIYSFFQCGRWIANIYVSWRVHCILIRLVCLIFVWAVRSIRGVNVVICFVIRLQFTFSMSGSFFPFIPWPLCDTNAWNVQVESRWVLCRLLFRGDIVVLLAVDYILIVSGCASKNASTATMTRQSVLFKTL